MIERDGGGDAVLGKLVQQRPVVVEAPLVRRAPAGGWIRGQETENRYASRPSDAISATSSRYRW